MNNNDLCHYFSNFCLFKNLLFAPRKYLSLNNSSFIQLDPKKWFQKLKRLDDKTMKIFQISNTNNFFECWILFIKTYLIFRDIIPINLKWQKKIIMENVPKTWLEKVKCLKKNKKEELINHLKKKKKLKTLCERFKRSARGSIAPITPHTLDLKRN